MARKQALKERTMTHVDKTEELRLALSYRAVQLVLASQSCYDLMTFKSLMSGQESPHEVMSELRDLLELLKEVEALTAVILNRLGASWAELGGWESRQSIHGRLARRGDQAYESAVENGAEVRKQLARWTFPEAHSPLPLIEEPHRLVQAVWDAPHRTPLP